jgi:hypothetical protein
LGFMDSLKGIKRAKPGAAFLPKPELINKILDLNRDELPFRIETAGDIDLVAEWKIVDAAWYEIFAKAGLEKTHKVWLYLNEEEKTVKVLEESFTLSWRAGVPTMSVNAEKFQGRTVGSKSFGVGYAFKGIDPLSYGQVYNYRFDVSEMKNPLIEITTGAGWDFVPVVTRKKLQ